MIVQVDSACAVVVFLGGVKLFGNIATMSNHHQHMRSYQHVESLVRDLHTAKNIVQPEQFASQDANFSNRSHSTHPCRSTVSNAHHKFGVHHLGPPSPPLSMIIDEDEFVATDHVNNNNNNASVVDIATKSLATKHGDNASKSKENAHEIDGLTIPAVMVNDVSEPLDLISTTQRRFSLLYSGLRRLSTSNTVGVTCSKSIAEKMMMMMMLTMKQNYIEISLGITKWICFECGVCVCVLTLLTMA